MNAFAQLARVNAASLAWDEAAECLTRHDVAGFDAAMRIFRKLNEHQGREREPNKPLPTNQ